jgi:hypothetical protein
MYPKEYYTVDYIKTVLALHPMECVFELDAPQRIVERLSGRSKGEWMDNFVYGNPLKQEFLNAFHQSEIYCPHEGIDRTKEVGVSLDWNTRDSLVHTPSRFGCIIHT